MYKRRKALEVSCKPHYEFLKSFLAKCVLYGALCLMWSVPCACSTNFKHVWHERFFVASRLHDEGKFKEADAHYEQLIHNAPNEESRRAALRQRADLYAKHGDVAMSITLYIELYKDKAQDQHGAHAMGEHVTFLSKQGDLHGAQRLRMQLIDRYPDELPAEIALRAMRRDYEKALKLAEFEPVLLAYAKRHARTDLGDVAYMELGSVREVLGKPDEAIAAYDAVVALDAHGVMADDAIWSRAEVEVQQGRFKDALLTLERLAGALDASWFVGSFESQWSDDARLKMGEICAVELKDYVCARAHYERLVQDFPDSLLCDDAAYGAILARRAKGDESLAQAIELFLHRYPESKYVRRLTRLQTGTMPQDEVQP